jgi:TolA-binding protein
MLFECRSGKYRKCVDTYPGSPLVSDSIIRIGNIYLKDQRFADAAENFMKFQQSRPTHRLAPQALFLAAQCADKLENFKVSADRFSAIIDTYPEEKSLCAEAMYWLGDVNLKAGHRLTAFHVFTRLVAEFPDSQWTQAARGRLAEDVPKPMRDAEK